MQDELKIPIRLRLLLWLQLLLLYMLPVRGMRRLSSNHRDDVVVHDFTLSRAHYNATTNSQQPRQQQQRQTASIPSSREDHRITELPLLAASDNAQLQHYAGHLPASPNDDKYLFYWLFYPSHNNIDDDTIKATTEQDESTIPLVIWLNGGPGCSSMDGLFLENGALRFNQENKLTLNPHSWHLAPAYVVYLDQPVGTGLSFTKSKTYPKNDEQVNADVYFWLLQFLMLHKDAFLVQTHDNDNAWRLKRPLYFTGESHAGHYIPSMMEYILQQNPTSNVQIPLSGAAIGNGWVDPFHQYAAAQAAYGHGVVGLAQVAALQIKEQQCQHDLSVKKYRSRVCFDLLDTIVDQSEGGPSAKYRISQYDVRRWEPRRGARTYPEGHKTVESYLGGWQGEPKIDTNKVLQALHATEATVHGQRYQECTDPPYNALSHQDGLGVVPQVVNVLEHNITMLFFNGVMDLICNHVGNEVFLDKMKWKYQREWTLAPRYSWKAKSSQTPSGFMKEYKNLKFLKILDSGHMVPMDVPEVALDMMRTLMYGGSFHTGEQGLDRALPSEQGGQCEPCPTCEDTSSSSSSSVAASTDVPPPPAQPNPVTKYVIAHSWLGALLTVSVFLAVLLWVRRRQSLESRAIHHRRVESSTSSYDLELKDNEMELSRYRDDPEESSSQLENGSPQSEDRSSNSII